MHMERQLDMTKLSELLSMKDNISGMLSPSEKLLYVYDTHGVECIMYLYVQSILLEFLDFNVCVISAGWLVH